MYGYNGTKVLRLISKALRLQPFSVVGKPRPGSPAKLQIQILAGSLKLGDLGAVAGPTSFLRPIGIADDMEDRGVSFTRDVQVQTVENNGDEPRSPTGVKGRGQTGEEAKPFPAFTHLLRRLYFTHPFGDKSGIKLLRTPLHVVRNRA